MMKVFRFSTMAAFEQKKAFHSGYAWYMRTNGKAFSRKVLDRGNAILVPRSCVMPMFGLRGRVVVACSRKNRTLQDNPHAFARGGDAAHTKKGRISLVDFSLLGKTGILYNGYV